MLKRIPTYLSGLRLAAGPLIFLCYALEVDFSILSGIFLTAALTDALDGVLARRWNVCTKIGAWLDHLSDKVLVTSSLYVICMHYHDCFALIVLSWLTVQRELIGLAARSYPIEGKIQSGESFSVSALGKIKTVMQCLGIFVFFVSMAYCEKMIFFIGLIFFSCSVLLAWISLARYLQVLYLSDCSQDLAQTTEGH